MLDTRIILLVTLVAVLALYKDVANYVSRKRGAKVPLTLTKEGRKLYLELLKSGDCAWYFIGVLEAAFFLNAVFSILLESYVLSFAALGFLSMLAGACLNIAARRDLGKNWSLSAGTAKGQKLVKTGVYARIRHPIFLSSIMLNLGIALVAGNSISLLLFVLYSVAIGMRIKQEEKALVAKFGKRYKEYAKQTPALAPRL
jgi:protein-S-isoprenylcysteine O-methyltransferase Ste14